MGMDIIGVDIMDIMGIDIMRMDMTLWQWMLLELTL